MARRLRPHDQHAFGGSDFEDAAAGNCRPAPGRDWPHTARADDEGTSTDHRAHGHGRGAQPGRELSGSGRAPPRASRRHRVTEYAVARRNEHADHDHEVDQEPADDDAVAMPVSCSRTDTNTAPTTLATRTSGEEERVGHGAAGATRSPPLHHADRDHGEAHLPPGDAERTQRCGSAPSTARAPARRRPVRKSFWRDEVDQPAGGWVARVDRGIRLRRARHHDVNDAATPTDDHHRRGVAWPPPRGDAAGFRTRRHDEPTAMSRQLHDHAGPEPDYDRGDAARPTPTTLPRTTSTTAASHEPTRPTTR